MLRRWINRIFPLPGSCSWKTTARYGPKRCQLDTVWNDHHRSGFGHPCRCWYAVCQFDEQPASQGFNSKRSEPLQNVCRCFHKGVVGGQVVRVSACPKVHRPWVSVRRPRTFDAADADATPITSRKRSARPVVMANPQGSENTTGPRKLTAPRRELFSSQR